jgi:hypothetical protein
MTISVESLGRPGIVMDGADADLSGFICVEGECSIGRNLVREMGVLYTSLIAQVSAQQEFVARFGATVASIQAQLEQVDSWAVSWVPFHPGCCTILEIGRRAQDISRQMRTFAGVAQPPEIDLSNKGLIDSLLTLVKWTVTLATVAAVGVGAYYGVKTIRATIGKG